MPFGQQRFTYTLLKFVIPALALLFAASCATIVTPTGGPKDVTPPKMLSSEPANLSTNFTGDKLVFNFDEFVDLKNPEKYLLISPPMDEKPVIKIKGHSVVIKIKDSLRVNTTYNFYLGEAIVDITESNPVKNFNFAFSTGPEIDSLSVSGNVTDAFTRMPAKDAMVMLFTDFGDSVPMKSIPTYVSRTMENGDFQLHNLASGKYRAVALTDGNSDYLYNLPSEMIGFSSDTVVPYYSATTMQDTNVRIPDAGRQPRVSINIFPEPDSTQRILKSFISAKNKLSMVFRYSNTSPGFRALNIPDSLPWAKLEWNRTNDTLSAWLLNKPDTLKLEVSDHGMVIDTVNISTAMKVTGRARNSETPTHLKYTSSLNSGMLGYGRPLNLTFTNPVKDYDLNSLMLTVNTSKDTTSLIPAAHFTDTLNRHLLISYNWNTNDSYDVYIPKASFTGIYSDTCDSTHVSFRIRPVEEYGRFAVTVNRLDQSFPVIIQLLSEKGEVLTERSITSEKRVDFGLLDPAKYGLKAIMDANANKRWDTGVFLKKIQPEKVLVHPKIFEVRTNWELEETWDL